MGEIVREPSINPPAPELPNDDLMHRIAGTADKTWFWKSGQISIDQFDLVLAHWERSLTDFPRALDFGCGCARIELHLEDAAKRMEIYGVDIDAAAIAWAAEHVPWAKFSVNRGLPPLEFPDEHFDLVFNHSVFTHLDEQYQDAWLVELERVTKPGGLLIVSVSGEYPFSLLEKEWIGCQRDPEPLREILRNRGILFISDDGMQNSPFPDFYHTAFHAPWYIFERWGSVFDIKAYVPRGDLNYQDLLLLRRRDQRVGAVAPLRKFSSEEGASREEISHLEMALRRAEQEKQTLKENFSAVLNSRSWRLTAPLRRFMQGIRGR